MTKRGLWLAGRPMAGSVAVATALLVVASATSEHRRVSLRETADTLAEGSHPVAVVSGVLKRIQVIHADRGRLFGVEDHFVYVSHDSGRTFHVVGRLPKAGRRKPLTLAKDRIARARLARAIRRNRGPGTMAVLESGTILVFYDHIYRLPQGKRVFEIVGAVPGDGVGPFPGNSVTVGAGDTVYFGGYTNRPRPHPVQIIRGVDDGRRWEIAYTFPSGAILHVHSVTYDSFRRRYWVTTGDRDGESHVLWSDDGFRTLDTLGGGSQDWRVVAMLPRAGDLLWGSDDDQAGSSIYRYDFASRTLERVFDIGRPSYFSALLADGTVIVTTTFEPESPWTRSAKAEPTTSLFASRTGSCWREIARLAGREESTPGGAVRPLIRVPGGDGTSPSLFITPHYSDWCAFCAVRIDIMWDLPDMSRCPSQ